tara:strand:- start:262 stop:546 length:285 start_codon:yes stop_codon:yes gene_type:complete
VSDALGITNKLSKYYFNKNPLALKETDSLVEDFLAEIGSKETVSKLCFAVKPLQRKVINLHQRDFESGRVYQVEGWYVSKTELVLSILKNQAVK